MAQKILFVVNHGSGSKNVDWEFEIQNALKNKQIEADIYELEKPVNVEKLQQYIRSTDADRVVAIGGDGTVTLVGSLLINSGIPLGIIPGGSANGMAKELMIPHEPAKAIEVAVQGVATRVDMIRVNDDRLSLHLSDMGVNAQLVNSFETSGRRGLLSYARYFLRTLFTSRRFKLLVDTGDEKIEKTAVMVALANATKYGTGAIINPEGKITDALFEVVVVKHIGLLSLLKTVLPRHLPQRHVEVFHCKSVNIQTSKPVHFQVDGEYLGKIDHVRAIIEAGSLLVMLPEVYAKNIS